MNTQARKNNAHVARRRALPALILTAATALVACAPAPTNLALSFTEVPSATSSQEQLIPAAATRTGDASSEVAAPTRPKARPWTESPAPQMLPAE